MIRNLNVKKENIQVLEENINALLCNPSEESLSYNDLKFRCTIRKKLNLTTCIKQLCMVEKTVIGSLLRCPLPPGIHALCNPLPVSVG